MIATLVVTQGGVGNTLQDAGRLGFRHQGVASAGWLDGWLAQCANALVGNAPSAACLELRALGPSLQLRCGLARLALAGAVTATITRADGLRQAVAPWSAVNLYPGDTLQVTAVSDGCAYLAFAGDWDLPAQMGSLATDSRAGLGGINGRPLQSGDVLRLAIDADLATPALGAASAFVDDGEALRVVLGPQSDHFPPAAIEALLGSVWRSTVAQDRMGIRLQGPTLSHLYPSAADIVSDGAAPGVIQVPANGQPIVLLADCQTMGGYPKIATVISADLARLAHLPPGSALRFAAVDPAQARQALLHKQQRWQQWQAALRPQLQAGDLDLQALQHNNLISGVLDALRPEF